MPTPAPAVVEAPRPRPVAPYLNAMCLLTEPDYSVEQCRWDDGFPAISGDGTTIVMKSMGEHDERDISIVFLDVSTGRVQRDESIMPRFERGAAMPTPAAVASSARRIAAVQRTLEARSFRTLLPLYVRDLRRDDLGHQEPPPDGDEVYAERDDDMVRLIDPQTNTVIAQRAFSVAEPPSNANGECNAWFLKRLEAWWDPSTKTLLGESGYTKGGCMCGFEVHRHVFRLP